MAGVLSCHISISEGIAEESSGTQNGWISTDRQKQGLMFDGGKKNLLFPLLFFKLHSARTPAKDE